MLQRRRARVQVGVTGEVTALSRCLRGVFLRSSSIKLGFSDVSDSISLSQAVLCTLGSRAPAKFLEFASMQRHGAKCAYNGPDLLTLFTWRRPVSFLGTGLIKIYKAHHFTATPLLSPQKSGTFLFSKKVKSGLCWRSVSLVRRFNLVAFICPTFLDFLASSRQAIQHPAIAKALKFLSKSWTSQPFPASQQKSRQGQKSEKRNLDLKGQTFL